jgi:hypothetical protein
LLEEPLEFAETPFDAFAGKKDVEFLPTIGERGWVLVTKDKNVRRTLQTRLMSQVSRRRLQRRTRTRPKI